MRLRLGSSPYSVAVILGVFLATGLIAWLWEPSADFFQISLEVSIGLFASIISALAFVFALTIEPRQVWPPILELFRRAGVQEWLALAISSVVLAVLGEALSGRLSIAALSAAMVLSLMGLGAGLFSLRAALLSAGGRGRTEMLAKILRDSLPEHKSSDRRDMFASDLRKALEASDSETLRDRVEELILARRLLSTDPPSMVQASALQLQVLSEVGRRTAFGSFPPSGVEILSPLVEDIITGSSELMQLTGEATTHHEPVLLLCEATRICGRLWNLAYRQAQVPDRDSLVLKGIMDTMTAARSHLRIAADPDPPAVEIRPHDPWARGLDDPGEGLVWCWSWIERGSPRPGEALYILCEVLTGKKFYGSYGEGASPVDFIDRELSMVPEVERVVAGVGGWRRATLEFATAQISGMPERDWEPPPGVTDLAATLTTRERIAMRLRQWAFPMDPNRLQFEEALAGFAHLVSSGQSGGRLWRLVEEFFEPLGQVLPTIPRLSPPLRPIESAICVALRTLPMDPGPTKQTEKFLRRLPVGLLEQVAAETRRSIGAGDVKPDDPVRETIENLTVVWEY